MKSWVLIPAVLLLAGCENGFAVPDFRGMLGGGDAAAVEPTLQLSDRERLVAAIAANGGSISPANVGPILEQASVSADQSTALLTAMVEDGTLIEGAPGSDTLTLAAGGFEVGNG